MAARTRLTLVRHGETIANIDGVWHGSTDTPLTERGHLQAERVAVYLSGGQGPPVDAIYSSDLRRAAHTARPIASALGHEVRQWPELREYDLGRWEGKTFRELFEVHRLWEHMAADPDYAPHGGESPRQVTDRLVDAFRRVASAHPGGRAIVVLHGGALAMALGHLLEGGHSNWKYRIDNCAVSELALGDGAELLSVNETGHLDGI